MHRRVSVVLACWLAAWICALPSIFGAEQTAPASAATQTSAELSAALNAFLDQPRFSAAAWGVKIAQLGDGRVLFERNASLRLSPASNSKLYSTAMALDRLGADHRIATPLFVTGKVTSRGELKGNLVVAGRADPSWNPRRDKKEFWTVFDPFIAAVRQAGIKRISGDIVADATFLRCTPQGAGWTADDLNDYYGAEISAITLEENYVDLRVTPAAAPGAPCRIELLQPCTGLELDNRTTTGDPKSARRISVLRLPGESRVVVFGSLPAGGPEEMTEATVPRPVAWFATALREALVKAGVEVKGRPVSLRWPERAPAAEQRVKIGEVLSPPVGELVRVILKDSQNLRTDLLFNYVGELRRTSETPAWRTSDELALTELKQFLCEHALRADDVLFDEGSGLSRNNLTTAAATVALLEFMAAHRDHEAYLAALPVAGVDGTLRRRLKGTAAEANVKAKTGTLRWANSLSGFVTSAGGEKLVFSLMLNRNVAPPDHTARQDIDYIILLLTQYRGHE